MKKSIIACAILIFSASGYGICPTADLNGDCVVNLGDLAIMASQWMSEGIPVDPENLFWSYIDDAGVSGHGGFTGEMSVYETTNAQYCAFLNAANASGDISVTVNGSSVLGASGNNGGADFVGQKYYNLIGSGYTGDGATKGGAARIKYSCSSFAVEDGFEDHPVTFVSWYGATAFCNYYGYRLPTEWEWVAAADYNGSYTYGCGTSINNDIANYYGSTHPNGTTEVGAFGSYGYEMRDMAGNVWEWTDSIYFDSDLVVRGGSWQRVDNACAVSSVSFGAPDFTYHTIGFRVCR